MDKKILPIWGDSYMNNTLAKRLFVGLATCFFIISTISTIGCTGSKIKVKYENQKTQMGLRICQADRGRVRDGSALLIW